jgi:hypothetical protein
MEKKWAELSWQEKREERFKRWLAQDIKFVSPQAEKLYKERVTRFVKTIKLEEPDRVPVMLPAAFYPAHYSGYTLKDVMYDYDILKKSWLKFMNEFGDMDSFGGPGLVFPGRVVDMIDYKLMKWPGHGLADDSPTYQFVEGEYMPPEEYDDLIRDPADYLMRFFLPRSVGALAPWSKMGPMTAFVGIPVWYISQFGDPDIRKAYQTLLEAGQECNRWMDAVAEVSQAALEAGYPSIWGGMNGAPYDFIGDMLRGTAGVMIDMFKRPDKLQKAMERLVPIAINETVSAADNIDCPIIFMPLHKGTGGFMSNKQFETFYWPTFKEVMLGLINEGLVPIPFAEGDYEPRLEIIKDMPRSSVVWYFERMDMAKAKKVLGDTACIAGNVPVSVLCTGTPQEVKEHCKRLIEACAKGGGYILTGSAGVEEGNPDNLRAMMEAAREYGTY